MQKCLYILALLLIVSIGRLNAQCTTCSNGMHIPDTTGGKGNFKQSYVGPTGSLSPAYQALNMCGLNFIAASTLVETRSQASGINTNGTGMPAGGVAINLSGWPASCFKIIKAFLYWDCSYNSGPANPAAVSIKNPAGSSFPYSVAINGSTSQPKCWGETGTVAYKEDVTACISGPGTYYVSISGAGNSGSEIDGITLFVIYQDLSANYSGSLTFYDGMITTSNNPNITYTASGFSVCNTPSKAQAFALQADMQQFVGADNYILPCSCNTNTYNGTTATFSNDFYNYNLVNTTVTAGQTSAAFDTYTNDFYSGTLADCYSLMFVGLYWQNTNCTTCTPEAPTVSIAPVNPTICNGAGGVALTASGGVTYKWSTGATTSTISVNPSGNTTYSVTGYDANGCSAPASDVVTVDPGPSVTIGTAPSTTICSGTTAVLTANGASTYVWSTAATTSSISVSPGTSTTYSVTGKDGNGCTGTQSQLITVNTTPTLTPSTSFTTICTGSSTIISASGGTTYSWSTGATSSGISVNPVATTTYTVKGTTGGCTSIAQSIVVNVDPTVSVSITPASPSICSGSTAVLTANGASTYVWSTTATTSVINVSPTSTQSYSVTGKDAAGCNGTASVTVNIGSITVTATPVSSAICSGASTTINAAGALTYLWSNGATASSITVSPLVTTTYSVTGTSGTGCIDSAKAIITVNTTSTISATFNSATVCPGDTTQAYVTVTGAGTPPYTFNWNTTPVQTNDTARGLGAGTYTVSITDASHCTSDTATVTITTKNIVVTASSAPSSTICAGSSTTITATGATNYIWNNGVTSSAIIVSPAADSTYKVIGTTTGTCKDSATVSITVTPLPNLTVSAIDTAICSGQSTIVSASGATSYTWIPSTGLTPTTGSPVKANPAANTTYSVIGTALGCRDTASIIISVNATPTASIKVTGNDTVCSGNSVTLTASGGTTYVWNPGGATSASVNVSPATSPTTYTVTAISANGACKDVATVPIYIFTQPLVTMNAIDSICSGQSINVQATVTGGNPLPGYIYSWTPNIGSGSGPYTVKPSTPTTYSCIVTDGCGNPVTGTTFVFIGASPVAQFAALPNPIQAGQYVAFVDSSTSAAAWYWTFGDGNSSTASFPYEQYLIAGNYVATLWVTGKDGCRDSAQDTIHVLETIFIPNVFTPNGDGQNDVFHVTATDMKTYSIEIFNRWGELVFTAISANTDWDGRSQSGVMESDGTYYYKIIATDYAGKTYNFDGYLQLIGGGAGQ